MLPVSSGTKNWYQKTGTSFWYQFSVPISGACVFGIRKDKHEFIVTLHYMQRSHNVNQGWKNNGLKLLKLFFVFGIYSFCVFRGFLGFNIIDCCEE